MGAFGRVISRIPAAFLKALGRQLSNSSDKKLRYARKLDHPLLTVDGGTSLTLQETIADQNELDPLALAVEQEALLEIAPQQASLIKILKGSLAHAYTQLLDEFGDFKDLSAYLHISPGQCRKRYNAAIQLARYQYHLPFTSRRRKITALLKPWRRSQPTHQTRPLHGDCQSNSLELNLCLAKPKD